VTGLFPGALALTGWVAPAPTGHEEAYLLLVTVDPARAADMPAVADALGLTGLAGSLSTDPTVHVTVGSDGWITLHTPGGETLSRPGGAEWVDVAVATRRVVLVVGMAPMPSAVHPDRYTQRYGATSRLGMVPVR
jgi:hypothetical protein